jgi:hypothetical protein
LVAGIVGKTLESMICTPDVWFNLPNKSVFPKEELIDIGNELPK